jgi:outer membrane biosynthesis protein TonB
MRNILVATLALAPVLVHAQASSPAQPGAQVPVLESKLVSPAAADGAASPKAIRPVSDLLEPKLIKWSNVGEDYTRPDSARQQPRAFAVAMTVTADGVPTHLRIVDSNDPLLNNAVLDAVAQYRFTPGSLNSTPTAVPLVLKVNVLPPQR